MVERREPGGMAAVVVWWMVVWWEVVWWRWL
jgi:hypothetical protein